MRTSHMELRVTDFAESMADTLEALASHGKDDSDG